eukprot:g4351.t1
MSSHEHHHHEHEDGHHHDHDHGHTSCGAAAKDSIESLYGWYDLAWSGGSFEVCFRPGGHFFAPKFQASSKYELVTQKIEEHDGDHGHGAPDDHAGHAHGHAHDGGREAGGHHHDHDKGCSHDHDHDHEKHHDHSECGGHHDDGGHDHAAGAHGNGHGHGHGGGEAAPKKGGSCGGHQKKAEKKLVRIDWGSKFGQYELEWDVAHKSLKGQCTSSKQPDPEKDWRTAAFKRPLSAVEVVLCGEGAGSEWMFQWSGGEFPIVFKGDGYNHFQCTQFPAHAHWELKNEKELTIYWEKYGTYELQVDAATKTMAGCEKGKPDNWRKARFTGNLPFDGKTEKVECSHHH